VLQEQLGVDITNVLLSLSPQGTAVVIRGIHNCMVCRGVKKKALITTSYIKGCFDKEPAARQELFDLMKMAGNKA
jgi:GTP cyclohydrolase I